MTISRFIAVPLLAGLSVSLSLALLPLKPTTPASGTLAVSALSKPA